LAVGLRPCSGALIVLVFALAQGFFLAGVVATLAMGLGTGLTVATLVALAAG
ncbi:HoxN/HupN/NixA family nickel/cobalt transporter, partial [Bordetella pertussis]